MLKVPDSEAASAPWFPSLHVGSAILCLGAGCAQGGFSHTLDS